MSGRPTAIAVQTELVSDALTGVSSPEYTLVVGTDQGTLEVFSLSTCQQTSLLSVCSSAITGLSPFSDGLLVSTRLGRLLLYKRLCVTELCASAGGDLSFCPALAFSDVIVAPTDHGEKAVLLDQVTLEERAKSQGNGSPTSAVCLGDRVYLCTDAGEIWQALPDGFSVVHKEPIVGTSVVTFTAISALADFICVGDLMGRLRLFQVVDGEPRRVYRWRTPSRQEISCLLAVGSAFVVGTGDGSVFRLAQAEGRWACVRVFEGASRVKALARVGELSCVFTAEENGTLSPAPLSR